MTRLRMAALSALTVCAVSLGAAGTASAQGEPAATPLTKTVALKGTKGFKGTFTIDRFTTRNGELVAVGNLRGTMRKNGKTKRVAKNAVILPASVAGAGPATLATASQALPDIPNACQVLNLMLGPIDLNLLGLHLRIDTQEDPIPVRAEGISGALLGNTLSALSTPEIEKALTQQIEASSHVTVSPSKRA